MTGIESSSRLYSNIQERLKFDQRAVWLQGQYTELSLVDRNVFFEKDNVGVILDKNRNLEASLQYAKGELLKKLNLIVLDDTMGTTYAKIRKDGMPWLWGQGEFSKSMMVDHLRGIVEQSFAKHENDEFPDQLEAELNLLGKLRKMGEKRESDFNGTNYSRYVREVKAHDTSQDDMPFLFRTVAFFNPLIGYAADVFSNTQTRKANERITGEYLEINLRAQHWISSIKKHAEGIK